MDAHRAELETSINTAMVTACTRDAWSPTAAACIAKATTSAELDPCEKELNADQTAKLGEVLSGAMEAMFPQGAAPPAAAIADASACDRYVATVRALSTCDKVPAQVKEAATKSVEQLENAIEVLGQPGIPAETKASTYDACNQAATKLAQVGTSLGCKL